MHEQVLSEPTMRMGRIAGWFEWAERHPGVVLLGALAVAILALQESPRAERCESDADGEEVPLFI